MNIELGERLELSSFVGERFRRVRESQREREEKTSIEVCFMKCERERE